MKSTQAHVGGKTCLVSLEFGRRTLQSEQRGQLKVGSVVELGAFADDYVDVYADGRLIARGLPIVVDGKLGIRVQESLAPMPAAAEWTKHDVA